MHGATQLRDEEAAGEEAAGETRTGEWRECVTSNGTRRSTKQQRTNIPSPLNSGAVAGFWSSAVEAPCKLSLSFIPLLSF